MTDWRAAGQRADATIVVNAVRDRYSNPAKQAIRSWVVTELRAAAPTLVLDLWGGGASADEMTAAGLSVLSVDDGRGFAEHGITKARSRRALEIKAEAGGYRSGWGSVAKFAPECDAAWLDFMGHLCGDTVRILKACRHMKALAVTLMPDRMAGVANLPIDTWVAMYRAAIELHSGLIVRLIRKYRRESGQWVVVLVARGAGWRERANRARALKYRTDSDYRAKHLAALKARRLDPAVVERQRAQCRAYYVEHREHLKARQRAYNAAKRAEAHDRTNVGSNIAGTG